MGETVTFRLNDKEVTVPKGWTVMQAAVREKVRIPHFCWHDGLSVAGVCRFCMVKVEGRPKLEISCNLPASDGMIVETATDEVKEAHKWALEFHLINHPLDCPVCDQAGECGLQDYYMEVGKYQSQMTRPKVLKPKAMDVGSELVLDTERCILCSRCVRFEEEVTKTGALGIFDRGDRAIIGTYQEEKITHNYQENLVDICPVGAFTSKKFRFKQRVWFLKEKPSVCPGCSTGCAIEIHGRPEINRYYRVKPRHDEEVNGHWICDRGRQVIDHLNPEERLNQAWSTVGGRLEPTSLEAATQDLAKKLASTSADDVALLVSAQYTNEEYEALLSHFVGKLGVKKVYQWRSAQEKRDDFDGILLRGDLNPNTAGLMNALKKHGIDTPTQNQLDDCIKASPKVVLALAPEVILGFEDYLDQLHKISKLDYVSLWTNHFGASELTGISSLFPMKGFAEKKGHFTNYEGKQRSLTDPFPMTNSDSRDVIETIQALNRV